MDIWSKKKRSEVMSNIRSKDTKPEKTLRLLLHRSGFRFSLHRKDLPGNPDIVMKKYNTVIFVHGCFWHYHKECIDGKIPKSNTNYWQKKLTKTVERDKQHQRALRELGWNVIIIWECEIENKPSETLLNIRKKLVI